MKRGNRRSTVISARGNSGHGADGPGAKSRVNAGLAAYRSDIAGQKRNAILDAGFEIFLRDGFVRASMVQIAKKADVSSATLYKHFTGKAELFGSIMARLWQVDGESQAPFTAGPEVRADLVAISRSYARSLADDKVVRVFRALIAEAERFPDLGRQLYERAKRPYLARIEQYLREQHTARRLRVEHPDLATRQLLGMINDQLFWPLTLVPDLAIDDAAAERVIDQAVETFLARYQVSTKPGTPRKSKRR